MTTDTRPTAEGAVCHSIRLPTVRLKPSRLIMDGEEHDSLEALAHYLAVQCVTCLVDLVRHRNPLAEKELSSVIWLRTNGDIELVRETNYRRRSLGDLVAESLYVEVFRSEQDAVPFSSFHRWIADPTGQFVGDMKNRKHCIKPSWDHANSIAHSDVYAAALTSIEWSRLRIEPVSQVDAIRIVKRCRYRDNLRDRILRWILDGHFHQTLKKLSLFGLKKASQDHGVDFIMRYGRQNFYLALSDKVQRAIAEQATG